MKELCPFCDTEQIDFNGDFWTCEHGHEFNDPVTYSLDRSDYRNEEMI